jgi:deazaflavin-dependent oxidoreductase (nitroreductase family)
MKVPPRTRMRGMRHFTSRVVNPLTRLFAPWLPGFAVVRHVGRHSGRRYETPMNVFRRGDHYYFALTYGSDVDWLKNVLAAGSCEIRTLGRTIQLVEPELFRDEQLAFLPPPARLVERWNGVSEALRMRVADRVTP